MKGFLRAILASRLAHFAAIGGVLFVVAPPAPSSRRVSISRGYLDSIHAAQAEKLGVRSLAAPIRSEVDRRAVEDEVLYRESLRLGLDKDDAVVRQHLIQKTLVLAEDLGGASREPSRAEVEAYFAQHRDRYRRAEDVRMIHVFASSRDTLATLAGAVRAAESLHPGLPPPLGDAFPYTRDVRGGERDLAVTYGGPFAEAVFKMPLGVWSDAIESRFGFHLVKVLARSDGRDETFEEAEPRARLDLADARRKEAIAAFVRRAMDRYEVEVDGTRFHLDAPTSRLAMRGAPSGED